jgi:hypothetical protein
MRPRLLITSVLLLATAGVTLTGCASHSQPRAVTAATDAERSVLLDRVKQLDGEWETTDEKGQRRIGSIFKVSSAGSVVREVMFPGSDHEMTNLYHMDGNTLVLTHYCAIGNQPRMRAAAAGPNQIQFKFDSVTNRTAPDQMYMGQMTLEIVDADHIIERWHHINEGKNDPPTEIVLTRKKS